MLNATPLLRSYAAFRLAVQKRKSCTIAQEKQLLWLLRKARRTQFGVAHQFDTITSVTRYQKQVPLRTYEQFWSEYWKTAFPRLDNCTWPGLIPYFAVSSGTSSGSTKYIPCSSAMVRSNTKAGVDLLIHHIRNRPRSRILGGRSFMLGGSTDLVQESDGVWSGDLSGIAVKTLPHWAQARYFPPQELALIADWRQKIARLTQESIHQDIRMISGVPSWMIIFFEALQKSSPGRSIADLYPNLEMVVHGGVRFDPYRSRFADLLQGSQAELREVYPASEGFIGIADRGSGEGLRLVMDHGIFYEFVPLEELNSPNPRRHWLGSVEVGVQYAIVLTTCAGLWSYVLGDTVRFVELDPPRLLITGRVSYDLSAFGEHLTAEEVDQAVSATATALDIQISDYAVGALYPSEQTPLGGHRYYVEAKLNRLSDIQLAEIAQRIDTYLQKLNDDYRAHRAEGFGLRAPEIVAVPPGTFERWMEHRGKLGGQNKVPRIITRPELFEDLALFVQNGKVDDRPT